MITQLRGRVIITSAGEAGADDLSVAHSYFVQDAGAGSKSQQEEREAV